MPRRCARRTPATHRPSSASPRAVDAGGTAPGTPASNHARPARRALASLVTLVLGAVLNAAMAQQTPVVTLNTNRLEVGGSVELSATFLRPEAPYAFVLKAPDGSESSRDVTSDSAGRLRASAVLTRSGRWSASLSGPDIEATFFVNVLMPEGSRSEGAQDAGSPLPTAPLPETPPGRGAVPPPGAGASPNTTPNATPEARPGTTPEASPGATPEASPDASEQEGASPQPDRLGPAPSTPDAAPSMQTPGEGPASASVDVSLEDGAVVARAEGSELWRLTFPSDSGATVPPLVHDGDVYVGHGNSLLVVDGQSGVVARRYPLPAQVREVTVDGDAVAATVTYLSGQNDTLLLAPGGLARTVRFDADPALFTLLRREAEGPDAAARLAQDPTNPWLYVRVANAAASPEQAAADLRAAVEHLQTFYDAAQLARLLHTTGLDELAKQALDFAMNDLATRGYRPELLTDRALRDAYGLPLGLMEAALDSGDLNEAGFWAPTVYALSTPAVPETQAALRDYADQLRTAARATGSEDQRNAASLWRARSNEGSSFRVGRMLDAVSLTLGRNGWYAVAALLVAIVALHVTLLAKYWRPQSLALRQSREAGRRPTGAPRLFAMRYYSLTEKVVLVLMFAAVLALAAMAGWAQRGDDLPPALGSGTLASRPALESLGLDLDSGRSAATSASTQTTEPPPAGDDDVDAGTVGAEARTAAFVRGYAAQVAGDLRSAEASYEAADDVPGALNNLGVLKGDDALLQRALDVRPGYAVARYNLQGGADPSPFHEAYQSGTPLLAVPSPTDLRVMRAGTVPAALAAAFTNPWTALTASNPLATPDWLWYALVVLFLLCAAVTVLALLAPRPRLARNAPRTLAYHVLALLLPGTGLSDELWGVLLLVPWAIFGLDALLHLLPGGVTPAMPLETDYTVLGLIYALNLVAFIVEFISYRRRMRDLRHEFPDTARAYGMRVRASAG